MKVIFTQNVQGVANKGDAKNVKPGYYRNYLLPFGKAQIATDALLKQWEGRKKKMLIEKEQLKAQFTEMQRRMADAKLRLEKKVTKKGTLYGGVKAADIVKALKEQFNLDVPEETIKLKDQIKTVGSHDVELDFGEGVKSSVVVEIVEKK